MDESKVLERLAKLEDRDQRKQSDIDKLFGITDSIKKEQNNTNIILARMDEGISKLIESDKKQQDKWDEWDKTQKENANKIKVTLITDIIKWVGWLALGGFVFKYIVMGGK